MEETRIIFDFGFSIWEWFCIILVAVILSNIGRGN